ncbi:MAG: M50 family metallopeptidase [Gemmatimonadota bacterium]|nr:M50 family metallopeptidase [Gemmatimonadota bacterium]
MSKRRRISGDGRGRLRFAIGFAAYFVALWLLWDTPVVYPLKIFVVLLHEVSHGIAAVAGGGTIQEILITPNQGGACHCPGGVPFLTLSAGYLGSLAWGALLLGIAMRGGRWSRFGMAAVGVLVLAVGALYVRTAFGLTFALAFGAGLLASARWLPEAFTRTLLTALGLTSCLYAILDIKSDILDRPDLESDARMLAELTGVPTLVWGVLWIGLALAASWWLLSRAYRRA